MAHPLLRPRWLIGTVLVALIVTGCLAAGFWQLRRLGERRDVNAQVRARSGTTVPLPVSGFDGDAAVDELIYRKVVVSGTYDRSKEFLVRFRGRRGLPGYEVVTPLQTERGTVLVDRGWIPLEMGDRWKVPSAPDASGDEVTVAGLLAPPERGGARIARPASSGAPIVAGSIATEELARVLDVDDVYAVHLLATAGAADAPFPVAVDPPDLGEGPHRDYAIQWFLFATVGVVGWALLLTRRGPLARPRHRLPSAEQLVEGLVEG